MKILFLDIDGVLLPIGAFSYPEMRAIMDAPDAHFDDVVAKLSPEAIGAVLHICTKYSARIVLISTWRGLFPRPFIEKLLHHIGLGGHLHEDWFCRYRIKSLEKKSDIYDWIEDHEPVREALIIDDQDLEMPRPMRQIIPANPRKGLTVADCKRAARGFTLDEIFLEASIKS